MTLLYYMEPRAGMSNGVHGAMNKERQVCARRRVGEPAVSELFKFADGREAVSGPCLVSAQCLLVRRPCLGGGESR